MNKEIIVKYYCQQEERVNILSHAFGMMMSILALFLFVIKTMDNTDKFILLSVVIYAISLIIMFSTSTFYHAAKEPNKRLKFKIMDHAAIYISIAGTYTPICMVSLKTSVGYTLLAIVWSLAAIGVTLKLFFVGKFKVISTLAYVFMGWLIVFAIEPLQQNLSPQGIYWLILGGLSYTVGAILYVIPTLKYNHAIFHIFVLIGSFCHFISIYGYVI